jgi:hypothetical protein
LHAPSVSSRLKRLSKCFDNDNAVVLALSPTGAPPTCRVGRLALDELACELFMDYSKPGLRHVPHARCHVSFGDDLDIQRTILPVVSISVQQASAPPTHAYTDH